MNTMVACLLISNAVCAENQHSEKLTDVSALLRYCSQTLSAMDHVSLYGIDEVDTEPDFHDSYQRKSEYWIRRDGKNLETDGVVRYFDEKRKKLSFRFQTVVKKIERISWSWPLEATMPPKGGSFTKERGAEDLERACGVLDGYFLMVHVHNEPAERIPDLLLRKSEKFQPYREEIVAGIPCKVITAELPRLGRFTLWLAEGKGYLPLKIIHEMGSTDLNVATNQSLSELKRPDPDNQGEMISIRGVLETLDEVKIENVEGSFVAVSGRFTSIVKWSNGKHLKTVTKITRSEIKLRPHFDDTTFAIKNLTEGATLGNDDNPSSGVVYELAGGKAIPAFSDFSGTTEGSWPARSIVWIATWLVTGLVLLVFALRYIWRYKQKGT